MQYRQLTLPKPQRATVLVTDDEIATAADRWLRAGNAAIADRLAMLMSGSTKGGSILITEDVAERFGIMAEQ